MSQENVEAVRRQFESFNSSGMPDFRFLDPEIERHTSDRALERGVYHGHEGVKDFVSSGNESGQMQRHGRKSSSRRDSALWFRSRLRTRGKTSGIRSEDQFFQVWKLKDGRIVELRVYSSRAEAPEAVGLPAH